MGDVVNYDFRLHRLQHARSAVASSDTRHFIAAPRGFGHAVAHQMVIYCYGTGFKAQGYSASVSAVFRPDRCRQAQIRIVCQLYGFINRINLADRKHRTECFMFHYVHFMGAVFKYNGMVIHFSFNLRRFGADHRSLVNCVPDMVYYRLSLVFCRHGAQVHFHSGPLAHIHNYVRQFFHECFVNVRHDINTLNASAGFAAV